MKRPAAVLALFLSATVLLGAGVAFAVSDGNYSYSNQGCSGSADNSDNPSYTEPGCHNTAGYLSDSSGHKYASVSTDQTPDGTNVHSGEYTVDPGAGASCTGTFDLGVTNGNAPSGTAPTCGAPASAADPASGLHLYFGADDNLDSGEHDSSNFINNGPSDGGGVQLNENPQSVPVYLAALMSGNSAYLLTHPLPLVDFGTGACADGVCFDVQTQQRVIYDGGGKGSRDVTDYSHKQWDPYTCAGPTDTKQYCGGHNITYWNKKEGKVYAEPGVQVYEDPDPEASPIDPLYDNGVTPQPVVYPLPAAYVGTCGVTAGGGTAPAAPPSPVTNSAGQIRISTGC